MITNVKLKKVVVDSQLFVALMGSMFTSFFMREENTFRWPTFFLIFITFFSGYIYTKYQNTIWLNKILILNGITAVVCILLIIQNHNIERLYKWAIICGLGLLYNSRFLSTSIRQISFLKVFYVGFVWALINAWLSFSVFNVPIFFISLLYITALVLPFDIRDVDADDILTIPKVYGVKGTKVLACLLIVFSILLAFRFLNQVYAILFCISGVIACLLTLGATKIKKDSYFSFAVELCSGLPAILLLMWEFVFMN